jgi:hypothetical protein
MVAAPVRASPQRYRRFDGRLGSEGSKELLEHIRAETNTPPSLKYDFSDEKLRDSVRNQAPTLV